MISIDQARQRIRNNRLERQTKEIPIIEGLGRSLAEEVSARFPAF